MDVKFLGIGSAFNPRMDNTNGFFMWEDQFYLIDCGETAFGKLWNHPDFKSMSRITVVITHLHGDHAGSLASLISYSYYVLGKTIRVLHPLETVVRLLDLMGIDRFCYEYVPQLSGEAVSFEAVEVEHVGNMSCFGYVISGPEGRIYYSGDAKYVPETVIRAFLGGEIQRIYQDAALNPGDHSTHGSLAYLEKTFPPETYSRICCIHLDTDYRQTLREKGFALPSLYVPAMASAAAS
ncbi:MAG: MBL fold metallo-hydrolase [Treponema sp.]|jgi:ribonuclease BN (tRNA processing enzyme)|nr:MBL fold metallo-hydrolase [Treponema sp.]